MQSIKEKSSKLLQVFKDVINTSDRGYESDNESDNRSIQKLSLDRSTSKYHNNKYLDQYFTDLFDKTSEIPLKKEEQYIENAHKIYVLGDLEGRIDLLYSFLIEQELIDEELNWTGGEEVYVVQCGDQLDSMIGNGSTQSKRTTLDDTDLAVMLFMDFLNFTSKDRVKNILGNHEWWNAQQYYKDSKKFNNMTEDFSDMYRSKLFDFNDGVLGKILKRRNLIVKANNKYIFCHGGITQTEIDAYKAIKNEKFVLNEFFDDINNEINNDNNWNKNYATELYKNVLDRTIKIPMDYQGILWQRFADNSKFANELKEYIIITGHNTVDTIKFCYNNPVKIEKQIPNCDNEVKYKEPLMIMTDVSTRRDIHYKLTPSGWIIENKPDILTYLIIDIAHTYISTSHKLNPHLADKFKLNAERILLKPIMKQDGAASGITGLSSKANSHGYKYKYLKYKQKYLELKNNI